jgi:hypothetical protein
MPIARIASMLRRIVSTIFPFLCFPVIFDLTDSQMALVDSSARGGISRLRDKAIKALRYTQRSLTAHFADDTIVSFRYRTCKQIKKMIRF